ncbi:MAG: hypothetical protein LBQ81_07380 [Zoogloeaceae bacterium]|jgi:hypothetical protein|nr:hypothetical protein [Zoogloeaceae bacterium]
MRNSESWCELKIDVLSRLDERAKVYANTFVKQDSHTRYGIAFSPDTPPDVLTKLADDGETGVRCRVAGSLKTPCDAPGKLMKDGDKFVRQAVDKNPDAYRVIVEKR